MPQILPPEFTDAGSLERRTEHVTIELGAIGRTGARVMGNTHALESREGRPLKNSRSELRGSRARFESGLDTLIEIVGLLERRRHLGEHARHGFYRQAGPSQ